MVLPHRRILPRLATFLYAAVLLTFTVRILLTTPQNEFHSFGEFLAISNFDFDAYWCAPRVASQGLSPYLQDYRSKLSDATDTVRQHCNYFEYWNPPWSLPLLSVFRLSSNQFARMGLFITSLFCGVASILVLNAVYVSAARRRWQSYFALSIPALWYCLVWGQLSLVLSLVLCVLVWALQGNRSILAGIALALLTLKPQALHLVFFALGLSTLYQKKYQVLLSAGATLLTLIASAEFLYPGCCALWYEALTQTVTYTNMRSTANLVGALRSALGELSELPTQWLGVEALSTSLGLIVPLFAWLSFALLFYCNPRVRQLPAAELLPPVVAVSILCSPYAWLYEQSYLVVPYVYLVSRQASTPREGRKRRHALLLLLCVHTVTLIYASSTPKALWTAWWLPAFALFAIIWPQTNDSGQADIE